MQQSLAAAALVLAVLVLLGWYRHDAAMTRLFVSGFAPATYGVAIGMTLAAGALSLLAFGYRRLAAVLATAPFVYGALALLEFIFGWHIGLDTAPFVVARNVAAAAPVHLSLPGAVAFVLIGLGLWLNLVEGAPRRPLIVALLGGFLAALGAVAFVGYASGIAASYATVAYTPMSGLAAVDALLLGVGLIAQAWRDEAPTVGAPRWIPLLIGISGVVGTLILWQAITALERAHIQQLVVAKGDEIRDIVETQIQMRAAGLQRIARRWEFGKKPSRADWEYDVMLHVHDYGGYKAIQWVDPQLRIRWIVPKASNTPLVNRNSAFDATRRAALIEARDRRTITMTPAITLATGGTGFRIHVPLYSANERFEGFIVGVIQAERFFDLILKNFVQSGYDVVVMDGTRVVYGHANEDIDSAAAKRALSYQHRVPLYLPQSSWRLQLTPQPHLVAQMHSPLPAVVVFAGFAISLALAFLAYLAHTARLRNVRLQHEVREREAKERVLQESELRFRSVTESASDAIISADTHGNVLSWNQGAQRLFGYSAAEILGKSLSLLMPERYRSGHQQGMARVAREGHSRLAGRTLELEGLRKNGDAFPIEISLASWKVGSEVMSSGIIRDITDRKRSEFSLRERERQLVSAEKIAHLGSWEWDIASNRVTWSDELYRIYGVPQGEPVTYESYLARIHPEDRARIQETVAASYRSKAPFSFQHRVVHPDGSERMLRASGEVISDERGQPIRMTGASLDVTEQVRTENLLREAEAVRKSEQHFRVLADSAPVLIWMTDRDGRGNYFNKPWLEFTGRTIAQESDDGWRQAWHSDDRERVTDVYRDALAQQRAFAIEQRLRRHDGAYRWVVNHGVPRFVHDEFVGFVGSAVDIHERKEAEEQRLALLAAERRARADAEAAHSRLAFVAEVSAVLAQTLDYEKALSDFARAAVPRIADWCAVDLANDNGTDVRRVVVVHDDPEKTKLGFELSARYPSPPESMHGPLYVLRSGKVDWMADIGSDTIEAVARDARHLEILRALDLRSYIAAPLISRGRTLGVVTFVMAESKRRYTQEDVVYVEDLARRCAVAVDNARLYQLSQAELSERLRTEESLAAEKERLAVTLYSIGDGVVTVDTESRVVLLNKVAEQLTGWSQAQALGRPLTEVFNIVNEKTRKEVRSPVTQVLRTGKVVALANHTVLIARDGRERAIADSGAPIHDSAGNTVGVVLVFRDVTEQQRMEHELTKARNLEAIGLLAGGIAHDFNNILTAILGNIALAKMYSESDSRVAEVLNEAEKAFWRARDLTQQLLTFAKGGAPIKKTASVRELLSDTASFALRGGNARLELAIADDLWPAEFDRGQISQVINNLVLNAKQAMPGGGILRIRAANVHLDGASVPLPAGDYLRIEVGDTGIGIVEKNLAKIFDPYFTTKQQGSGLGLAIAYSIIAKHGGHIDVRSTVGVGTTFSVYLPALPQGETVDDYAEESEAHDGHGKRILVMDDEAPVRQVLGGLLSGMGYEVMVAHDGGEMLELYVQALNDNRRFDTVIMDLTVPGGMGGREGIARLLEIDPDACAIVSSGYSNDPVMANYAEYGFRGMVAKPYQLKELSIALNSLALHPPNNQTAISDG